MKKIVLLIFLNICFAQANSQNWYSVQKIVASDRAIQDLFGKSVSISGNHAIVGAVLEDEDTSGGATLEGAGSAYIFERDSNGNWDQSQKIVASDRDGADNFGYSVSISGDYVIVGARNEGTNPGPTNTAGAAYIFERDSSGIWYEVQKIVASDRSVDDRFGSSISISGNYAIIGAPLNGDTSGGNFLPYAGSAYIFERDSSGTWNEVQKIVASDRDSLDGFADNVSISGNYAIISSGNDKDTAGGNFLELAGSAYVFERDSSKKWNEVQKIVASDREWHDKFGCSVSISGNYAIVGALEEDHDASGGSTLSEAGSAYIFERDFNGNWNQVQKIVASDRAMFDYFGVSVSISGDYAVVGAYWQDKNAQGASFANNAGAAYIFNRDVDGTWNQIQKITASDWDSGDRFGNSVCISGDHIIAAAMWDEHDASGGNPLGDAGSAYIFRMPPLSIIENNFGPSFSIYPNPATGKLTIDLGKPYRDVHVVLRNVLGEIIFTRNFGSTDQLSFEIEAAKGLYFLEVHTEEDKSGILKVIHD